MTDWLNHVRGTALGLKDLNGQRVQNGSFCPHTVGHFLLGRETWEFSFSRSLSLSLFLFLLENWKVLWGRTCFGFALGC